MIQQAYVCGVSTRRVDQLVESLGLRVSKSEVSRICGALDEHVEAFRTRPLEGRYAYVFLDAKVEKVRDGGRVVNKALVIAHGVHETGRREILSIDVGEAETEAFWTGFLRGLVKRGLVGVQLAISDAHAGLKAAIAKVLGCAWKRCTVHFLRGGPECQSICTVTRGRRVREGQRLQLHHSLSRRRVARINSAGRECYLTKVHVRASTAQA